MIDWNYIDKLYKDITKKKVSAVEFLQNNLDDLVFLEQDEDMSFIHIGDYTHGMFLYLSFSGEYYFGKLFKYRPGPSVLPNSIEMNVWFSTKKIRIYEYEDFECPNLYEHIYSKWDYVVSETLTGKQTSMWEAERLHNRPYKLHSGILNGMDSKLYINAYNEDFWLWKQGLCHTIKFKDIKFVFCSTEFGI